MTAVALALALLLSAFPNPKEANAVIPFTEREFIDALELLMPGDEARETARVMLSEDVEPSAVHPGDASLGPGRRLSYQVIPESQLSDDLLILLSLTARDGEMRIREYLQANGRSPMSGGELEAWQERREQILQWLRQEHPGRFR